MKFVRGAIFKGGDCIFRNPNHHTWECSSAYKKYLNEIKYKGWFKDFGSKIIKTKGIIFAIGKKLEKFIKNDWKARVPKCEEICGIFTTDIKKFIIDTIDCRLKWCEW
jgi:hypothetical protein